MQVLNLLNLISQFEDEKMECVIQGAEFKPELQMRMAVLDRKLEKLYAWYAKAFLNGLVEEVPEGAFAPFIPPLPDRRKANKA